MTHKPTKAEIAIINACAERETGFSRRKLRLEPGLRINVDDSSIEPSLNVALVTREEGDDFGDTDLCETVPWTTFTAGFELAEGGRAIVDFYCYSIGQCGELQSNVTAYWRDGKLSHVSGVGRVELYRAEAA
ncbi:hypothetical protein [Nevskia ramosa]|uniref:hypothetical protein n=1 Tax=Nevskia ramosa TaxID=64002 RepID=UPI003D143AA2